ncbi:hypothetical protein GLOTRDRAFT_120413 [Gloeophyllum trabeum ATCC 11539]|uniref:Uncharacterized protein n=1 Tax=Gloeophyllum trabeum (strain ATCC 11539 / FP-39264 / Madison 617) TaxID=670483 RepID=S7QCF4_GLOTA|nr:uncharacterized protein GLOTRDRAFT_120413 [Gloeophyllum trabeum ATCC 11539]EPQ57058.1 hypothetical protein GLOTRDRAFT_120413 [Gloeophyllum trabeum ATCC 11539]
MSAAEKNEAEVLRPILMRSSTPAPSEKVLLYLESMSREEMMSDPEELSPSIRGDDEPPMSPGRWNPRSPRLTGGSDFRPTSPGNGLQGLRNGSEAVYAPADGARDDDLDSNVQERGTMLGREPGPEDEPGPRYISYGSGPSFGNLGPLRDSGFDGGPYNGFHSTPHHAAQVPLPGSVASPRAASINIEIEIEPPSSSSNRARTRSARGSERDDATVTGQGKTPSAMGSKVGTARGEPDGRPLSPRSAISRGPSQKSGATGRNGYAPNGSVVDGAKSPKPLSKAPSISPSDSPSNFKPKTNGKASMSQRAMSPVREQASPRSQPREVAYQNGVRSHASGMSGQNLNRAFSPHRHAPTTEDLFHVAMMNGAMSPTREKQPSVTGSRMNGNRSVANDPAATPTPSRPQSPLEMDQRDEKTVQELLSRRMSRTSMAFSNMDGTDIHASHFHDGELCVLLHALDDSNLDNIVKKAVQKAVRQRIKKLGLKYDNESIKQYRKSFHNHDPEVHMEPNFVPTLTSQEPPDWAKELMQGMIIMQQRLEGLGPKIDSLKSARGDSYVDDGRSYRRDHHYTQSELDQYGQTPMTQTVNIQTAQPTGTVADSMFQAPETEIIGQSTIGPTLPGSMHHHDGSTHGLGQEDEYDDDPHHGYAGQDTETREPMSEFMMGRDDSPGQQYLEEELYKLRVKPTGSQSAISHKTWEVARDGGEYEEDPDGHAAITESGMPEIPDGNTGIYTRKSSPPLPPVPRDSRQDMAASGWQNDYGSDAPPIPPWQRVHQRLLSWAIVWPMSELDAALNSTTRGHQVDEVALSIWSTQTYKRYVRSKLTDSPQGRVDRLFVPPNMADAISNAVYNGRHGDACAMLRDLWGPFGLEGMPRLLIVLAKHRSDDSHWVVHRFSLPDGSLTTYDTFPERCLPDGRPLGWWFAIRIAWPNAIYPSPDHLMQKMVRLHRPLQLAIDNSVAAAGIWRNLLMGSRAERSVDLERLRDLINTEVKNLRQRKEMGKLSISPPKPNWEDMN